MKDMDISKHLALSSMLRSQIVSPSRINGEGIACVHRGLYLNSAFFHKVVLTYT